MSSTSRSLTSLLAAGVAILTLVLLDASAAHAQDRAGNVGVGVQLGEPSGITLKIYQRPGFAYEVLAAWDLDEFFFLNGHALYERSIPDSPLRYYLGPGVVVGVREDSPDDDDFVIGISGEFGVNFFVERYEVFLHLTPRLGVIPNTEGEVGGGIGLRYYF